MTHGTAGRVQRGVSGERETGSSHVEGPPQIVAKGAESSTCTDAGERQKSTFSQSIGLSLFAFCSYLNGRRDKKINYGRWNQQV